MTTTELDRAAEITTAREIDNQLAAIWSKYYDARRREADWLKRANQYKREGRNRWADEAFAAALPYTTAKDQLKAEADEIEQTHYTGWTRFYFVKHIHNTQHCSSFRPTTVIVWLPDVSGLTEVEAVAQYGHTLCTKCFATAPVEGKVAA